MTHFYYRTYRNPDAIARICERGRRDSLVLGTGAAEPPVKVREKMSHVLLFVARCALRYAQIEKLEGADPTKMLEQARRMRERAREFRREGR